MKNSFRQGIWFIIMLWISNNIFAQKSYFQQVVNYNIKVELNDIHHMLYGFETITYINKSPDTLKQLYFHLWPNAYRNNQTAFARQKLRQKDSRFYYAQPEERGYIDSLDFRVNDKPLKMEFDPNNIDICILTLNKYILPSDSVVITTPFKVKIPGDFSRLGHKGQSYQITQWYPKPAVYDRDGWHAFPYLDQGEFYSEYGSFDVTITLPENYIVGATGELQDKGEIAWLDSLARRTSLIKDFDKNDNDFPESSWKTKTIRYKENNIHDFAWFADKRFHIYKDSVYLSHSKRWVTTYTMFTNKQAYLWKDSQEYIKDALSYYSKWYGDYPYKYCTAVQGAISAGEAMEYPTITVVGPTSSQLMLETMIIHEVGHNWFYGILGFNERRYPFMDEGINSFSEYRYFKEKYNNNKKLYELYLPATAAHIFNVDDIPLYDYYEIVALLPQRYNVDQPMNTPSAVLRSINYGAIIYQKSAVTINFLYQYLGEEIFNRAMRTFYKNWKFRHSSPDDFREAFYETTDKNLDWFFDDIVNSTGKIDYKILRAKNNKVLVKNTGDIQSPVLLVGKSHNTVKSTKWTDGFKGKKWIDFPLDDLTQIKLNGNENPEINNKNNILRTKGLFRRIEPIDIKMFQIVEKPWKTQFGILPVIGWNYYNKFMPGFLIYKPVIPTQKLDYQIMPMFGTGNNQIAGIGQITLHTFPCFSGTDRIDFTLSGRRFGNTGEYYVDLQKVRAGMSIFFKNRNPVSTFKNKLDISYTYIKDYTKHDFWNIIYTLNNKQVLHHNKAELNLQVHNGVYQVFSTFSQSISTAYSRSAFNFRVFGGFNIEEISGGGSTYTYMRLSGGPFADEQMDDIYLGRFENYTNGPNILTQQTSSRQGNFHIETPVITNKMITAQTHIKIYKLPVYAYGTVAAFEGIQDNLGYRGFEHLYETGISFSLRSFINIYFPLFYSSSVDDYLDTLSLNYWQRIRFNIRFDNMNIFRYRETMVE